jgi:hypothetical protein
MRPPLVSYDHEIATRSGNISVLHDGQPDVSQPMRVIEGGLTMKEHGDTVFTKAAVGGSRDQVPAVTAMDLADIPSPATAMAHSVVLLAKDAGVSHISLSTLETGAAGKIATDSLLFRRPGELRESRGFASPPRGRFAFSTACKATMTS